MLCKHLVCIYVPIPYLSDLATEAHAWQAQASSQLSYAQAACRCSRAKLITSSLPILETLQPCGILSHTVTFPSGSLASGSPEDISSMVVPVQSSAQLCSNCQNLRFNDSARATPLDARLGNEEMHGVYSGYSGAHYQSATMSLASCSVTVVKICISQARVV